MKPVLSTNISFYISFYIILLHFSKVIFLGYFIDFFFYLIVFSFKSLYWEILKFLVITYSIDILTKRLQAT